MNCVCLGLAALLANLAPVPGAEAKSPRTDRYGDPLPPGAVARLGTIRLRHADAGVTFSTDSKHVISCGCDGEVRVWDAATGKLRRCTRLVCGARRYSRVILSPDGATTAAMEGVRLFLHDTQSGAERGQIDIVERALVRFSPDSAALVVEVAANENGTRPLEIWDAARVKKRQRLADASADSGVIECVFSRDGKRLAGFTSAHDKIIFWDAQTGKLLAQKDAGGDQSIEALAFAPDGKTLAVGWGPSGNEKAHVQLLDAATHREMGVLPMPANVHAKIFGKIVFSPDSRLLAGSYAHDRLGEHGILLWDTARIRETLQVPERRLASFTFAPDGKTLACNDRTVSVLRLWGTDSGRLRFAEMKYGWPATRVVGSPNGNLLAADSGEDILLWDTATCRLLHTLKGTNLLPAPFLFSPDSKRLICSERGSTLALQEWEISSGKKRRRFPIPAPGHIVHGLGMSPDGKRLAAVASNGGKVDRMAQVFVWDALTAERLSQRTIPCEGRVGAHFALATVPAQPPLAFAPDGASVLRMWSEKKLEADDYWRGFRLGLEDVPTGMLLTELPKGVGLPVVFSRDGRLLAAPVFADAATPGHADALQGLTLMEAASGEEILRVQPGEFDYFAFTPEGRGVAAANKNRVRVWDVDTGRLLHEMTWPKEITDARGSAPFAALTVLPKGRIATAMNDGDILIWDLAAETWPRPKAEFERKPVEALWSDLEGDARTAQRAIRALAAAPEPAVHFLSKHLTSMSADRAHIDKLLADLDSDLFAQREAASHNLARIRERAAPRLRQALQEKPSLELRKRIEDLLAEPRRLPIETIRTLRAIDALERIGTPQARRILEKLTSSAAAVEARAAQGALQRLNRR